MVLSVPIQAGLLRLAIASTVADILSQISAAVDRKRSSCAGRVRRLILCLCSVGIVAQLPACLDAQSVQSVQSASERSQVRSAGDTAAVVEGVALDSLHSVPWSGATIVIQDLTKPLVDTISADENGHFRANVPGGHRYQLAATDSLANVLGLEITATLRTRPDSTSRVVFVLPTATSIIRLLCGPASAGAGALVGRVTSANHRVDPRNVTIDVNWVATQIDAAARHMASVSQMASANADKDGHFVVCGLPVPLSATIVAHAGIDTTTQVLTLTGDQRLFAAALALPSALTGTEQATDRIPQDGQLAPARVTVLTTTGKAIPSAEVMLDNSARFFTDSAGVARLWPGGVRTHRLLIRKLGFAPLNVTSRLAAGAQSVIVHLHEVSPVLETVVVTGQRDRARSDFALRARTGIGDYFTEADIAKLKPECLQDLLKRIPGLQVTEYPGCRGGVSALRGTGTIYGDPAANGCVRLIVDGGPSTGYDAVDVNDVLGVEYYDETTAPVRYGTQCAVVIVWTKETRTIN